MLETAVIDAIELSGGLLNNPNIMHSKIDSGGSQTYFQSEARAFKKTIHVPLILVGGIRSYDTAKQLADEGLAEYIAMSRPLIREPGLVKRWKAGNRREATCISCDNCFEPLKQGEGVSCVPLEPQESVTFFPQLTEVVPASPPHPPGTGYEVSIGLEDWDSSYIPIVKIQMLFNEKASERSLSFPLGTQDHQKVMQTIGDLLDKHRGL